MNKKTLFLAGLMTAGILSAQNEKGRVGINTDTPKATLDISKKVGMVATQPQGVIFPHFTTVERMIYNTTKKCVEWWNGTKWACTNE